MSFPSRLELINFKSSWRHIRLKTAQLLMGRTSGSCRGVVVPARDRALARTASRVEQPPAQGPRGRALSRGPNHHAEVVDPNQVIGARGREHPIDLTLTLSLGHDVVFVGGELAAAFHAPIDSNGLGTILTLGLILRVRRWLIAVEARSGSIDTPRVRRYLGRTPGAALPIAER